MPKPMSHQPDSKTPAVAAAGAMYETGLETRSDNSDSIIPPAAKLAIGWLIASHAVRPELAGVIIEAARLGGAHG